MSKKDEPRSIAALNRQHIRPAAAARNHWSVTPMPGIQPEDLLTAEYWRHVSREVGIKPMDRVEAVAQDGTWWAEYLVLHAGATDARLCLLHRVELDRISDEDLSNETHYVKWVSPPLRWGVIRKSDKERIKDGFPTREAAAIWMNQHARELAA